MTDRTRQQKLVKVDFTMKARRRTAGDTFCAAGAGVWAGVWAEPSVLLASWRTLVEPAALCFFPRRRPTKNSLEELWAREGLLCLLRMSLLHL